MACENKAVNFYTVHSFHFTILLLISIEILIFNTKIIITYLCSILRGFLIIIKARIPVRKKQTWRAGYIIADIGIVIFKLLLLIKIIGVIFLSY